MFEISLPLVAAWVTAVFLAMAGLVNLFNSRKVRELYERWDIPAHTFRTVGLLEIAAAIFLVAPDLRAWGIALAAPLIFGSVVILLSRGQYSYATPAIVMLAALGPATLAVPT